MKIELFGNALLRVAIQNNLVSFPANVPALTRRGVLQERMVELYFVRRWPVRDLCERYGLGKTVVQHLLSEWRIRAVAAGYIQEIDPDGLARLVASECDRESAGNEFQAGKLPQAANAVFSAGEVLELVSG